MPTLIALESAAQHLRAALAQTRGLPALLCGLRFFQQVGTLAAGPAMTAFRQASLREFLPDLAASLGSLPPAELLPEELAQLSQLITLAESDRGTLSGSDLDLLRAAQQRASARPPLAMPTVEGHQVVLAALFVEHYPEWRLPPRGRLMWLRIEAETRSAVKSDDQILIRNATGKSDDEFRAQADRAAQLARAHLVAHHGLRPRRRFRLDIEVVDAGAALTGPSLGLALAVGAVAAIAGREVLRETLTIPGDVAFSGALTPNGQLSVIDEAGLRLKLIRAAHAGLRHVVVPRAQAAAAWETVRAIPVRQGDSPLNIAAADDVADVLADRNLVHWSRRSVWSYRTRRLRRGLERPQVGVPILLVLLAILSLAVWPLLRSWWDDNPVELRKTRRGFTVHNQYGRALWSRVFDTDSLASYASNRQLIDLNGDGKNEILYAPLMTRLTPDANKWYRFDYDGRLEFARSTALVGQYPGDTAGVLYDFEHLNVARVAGRPIIITEAASMPPMRSHIRFWTADGDSLGWYINAGGTCFRTAADLNDDGREELLFHCFFNPLNGTSLLVLDADSAAGCSPPHDRIRPDGTPVAPGCEYALIFLPTSQLGRIDVRSGYGQPSRLLTPSRREIAVYNGESNQIPDACVIYTFDHALSLVRVSFTDEYAMRYQQLIQSGAISGGDLSVVAGETREAVRYWIDDRWVRADSAR